MTVKNPKSNLSDKILDNLSKELAKEIDYEVLTEALGWTRIELDPFTSNRNAVDIMLWVEENAQGNWYRVGTKFSFALESDAAMTLLKWS